MILQDQPAAPAVTETLFQRVLKYLNTPFIEQPGSFKVSIISLMMLVLVILIAALVSRFSI